MYKSLTARRYKLIRLLILKAIFLRPFILHKLIAFIIIAVAVYAAYFLFIFYILKKKYFFKVYIK
ncbi:uncharacterized protein TRIREDRAFT_112676 [Trichoderma reesei QM6a]|uniref:Predicted protein n=1 Tax=Hypocrea jecorina (strain QM6a) TaxID=431241 RepID=G0RXP1_HYPJQ|nr:uncharacterized protein TRIREDRAFT_112676 [Trichoderma reesei QM6a]EGR44049.1 predicted protein [Trichoderma reesei QM6a]